MIKKDLYQFLVFLLLVLAPCFMYAQDKKGLVGYWKFDEEKVKVAVDEVTNMSDSINYIFNNIKPYNDPLKRKGIVGKSLVFDGFSSWIQRPANKFASPV